MAFVGFICVCHHPLLNTTINTTFIQPHPQHLQVRFALRASIFANVLLSIAGGYAAIHSRSLAVFAALLDTLLDLVSQVRALGNEKGSAN